MTANITETEARQHARTGVTRPPRPEQGPERAWHDHRDLPVAGTQPRRSASAGEVVLAYLRRQAHTMMSLEPLVPAGELGHQSFVSDHETVVLRDVGNVLRSCNVTGVMRHVVLLASRSGDLI